MISSLRRHDFKLPDPAARQVAEITAELILSPPGARLGRGDSARRKPTARPGPGPSDGLGPGRLLLHTPPSPHKRLSSQHHSPPTPRQGSARGRQSPRPPASASRLGRAPPPRPRRPSAAGSARRAPHLPRARPTRPRPPDHGAEYRGVNTGP